MSHCMWDVRLQMMIKVRFAFILVFILRSTIHVRKVNLILEIRIRTDSLCLCCAESDFDPYNAEGSAELIAQSTQAPIAWCIVCLPRHFRG